MKRGQVSRNFLGRSLRREKEGYLRRQPRMRTRSNTSSPIFLGGEAVSIDLRGLKRWVVSHYPADHPLQVIQLEPDEIESLEEYRIKGEVWLYLSKIKQ